jgi:hypothetical protein
MEYFCFHFLVTSRWAMQLHTLTTVDLAGFHTQTLLRYLHSLTILNARSNYVNDVYQFWKINIFQIMCILWTHSFTKLALVKIISLTWKLICVLMHFSKSNSDFIRIDLSLTIFVWQIFLKCSVIELFFFVTLPECFKYGWALYCILTFWHWNLAFKF